MGFIHGIGHCAGHHDDEIPPNINRATFWRKQLLKIGAKLVIILALSRRWPGWNVLFPGGTSRFQHLCDGCSFLPHRFGRNSHGRFPRFLHGLRFCPCSRFLLERSGRFLRFFSSGNFSRMASFHTLLKNHAAIYLICHGFSPFKNRRGRRLSPYSPTPPHWSYSSGYSSPAYFSANSSSSMTTYSERR